MIGQNSIWSFTTAAQRIKKAVVTEEKWVPGENDTVCTGFQGAQVPVAQTNFHSTSNLADSNIITGTIPSITDSNGNLMVNTAGSGMLYNNAITTGTITTGTSGYIGDPTYVSGTWNVPIAPSIVNVPNYQWANYFPVVTDPDLERLLELLEEKTGTHAIKGGKVIIESTNDSILIKKIIVKDLELEAAVIKHITKPPTEEEQAAELIAIEIKDSSEDREV